jgi:hypothetical protein
MTTDEFETLVRDWIDHVANRNIDMESIWLPMGGPSR